MARSAIDATSIINEVREHISSDVQRTALDTLVQTPKASSQTGKPKPDRELNAHPYSLRVGTVTGAANQRSPYLIKRIGSSGWTRTSNPPVNSRMLCH